MDVKELAREFSENLAKTDAVATFVAAKESFENNQKLQAKMVEYNAQRTAIGAELSKDVAEQDKLLLERIRARMNELYDEIAGDPEYLAFAEAQEAFNEVMEIVNAEISFAIFGIRPEPKGSCTHDCSSCSSHCHDHH